MPWDTQDDNKDAAVRVKEGYDGDTGKQVTEFIVADKAGGEHHHIGIDTSGSEVFHNITPDK